MNPKQNKETVAGSTPPWLKTTLIALLILASVLGYAGKLFFPALAPISLPALNFAENNKTPLKEFNFQPFSSLLDKTVGKLDPEVSISFKGVLRGEKGTVAIVNDEMVIPGTEIEKGIRIISITNRTLTLQYENKTRQMTVGDSISIRR